MGYLMYRTRAIITRGLYNFYPLFEVYLCTVTIGLMYGYYSRAVSNQERVIVACVRYLNLDFQGTPLVETFLKNRIVSKVLQLWAFSVNLNYVKFYWFKSVSSYC